MTFSATLPSQPQTKVTDHANPDGGECVNWHYYLFLNIFSQLDWSLLGMCIGPLSPSLSMPLKPVDISIEEQQELGYMPLRDDFEKVQ